VTQILAGLGGTTVTVQSPVLSSGRVTLARGSDYKSSAGRALIFTITGAGAFQDDIASINFLLQPTPTDDDWTAIEPTFAVADDLVITVELTRAQTRLIEHNTKYYIEAVLDNSDEIPLTSGDIAMVSGGE
jgi:hypothetical protein